MPSRRNVAGLLLACLLVAQAIGASACRAGPDDEAPGDDAVSQEEPGQEQSEAPDGGIAPGSAKVAPPEIVSAFNAGGCAGCHTIPGVPGANGSVGPDLSAIGMHAADRRSGVSAEAYIRESILEPAAFIAPECPTGACPDGVMLPVFGQVLEPEALESIIGYLTVLGTDAAVALGDPEGAVTLDASRPPESAVTAFAEPPSSAEDAQVALGKYLFFDKRLSGNISLSCASCHDPEMAFTDGAPVSTGYPSTELFRNTPTIYNTAFREWRYWDGRMDGGDLPTLVRDHIAEAHFMSMDGRLMVERINQVPAYVDLFEEAWGGSPGYGGVLKSVAAYVSSLNTGPTAYDQHLAGEADALSADAAAGLALFEGKAECARCHSGALLTDENFHNLGLSTDAALLEDSARHVTFRRFFRTMGTPNFRNLDQDVGRYALSIDEADMGAFLTPSLREVARTAPYMHDGQLATLEDVVRFYDAGGGEGQRADLAPLDLSDDEVGQIVAFLESLSSELVPVEAPALPDYQLLPWGGEPVAGAEKPADEMDEGDVAVALAAEASQEGEPDPLGPLGPVPEPPDNPITDAKTELGRLLYFDPRMSGDGSLSCNSCHAAANGFGARTAISFGGPGTSHWRNASTALNVGYYSHLNWDGGKKSLEKQNKGAWGGAVAGNLDGALAEERLAQIPEYRERFEDVFGTPWPLFDDALRAVATYQRTLNSSGAPADAYFEGDESALSEEAKRGLALFEGEAGCIQCHNGPLVSDGDFYSTGVPRSPGLADSPLRQITFRYEQWAKGATEDVYRSTQDDLGFYYVTKRDEDKFRFRTPSLRDLCFTGPYMHNGVFETLDEVVDFYAAGGGDAPNKDARLQPLDLSDEDKTDLVSFLESLCGDEITDEAPELPPYGTWPAPEGGE